MSRTAKGFPSNGSGPIRTPNTSRRSMDPCRKTPAFGFTGWRRHPEGAITVSSRGGQNGFFPRNSHGLPCEEAQILEKDIAVQLTRSWRTPMR